MATRLTGADKREERRRRVASGDMAAPADSGYGIQGRAIPIEEKPHKTPPAPVAPTSQERVSSFGEALWRFFCSVRLAMTLIALIVIATLIGTLLIQMPPELQGDPASRTMWVKGLAPRFGDFTGIMYDLSLFNLFTSWWFKLLLLVLTLNIVVCTLNRFPKMWKQSTQTRMDVGPNFFTHGEYTATIALPVAPAAAEQQLAGVLKRRHLSVRLRQPIAAGKDQAATGAYAVYADRFRYMPLGTYLNHVGIVLIFIGAIWGTLLGNSIKIVDFAVPEGGDRAVGYDTNLMVHSNGFTEVDYPDGRPADYYSDIVLYENGKQVAQQRIRVNEPLEYKGILFHQAFFGNAADIKVTDDASGALVYQSSVSLAYRSQMYGPNNPMGSFSLANGAIQVDVVEPAGPGDPSLRPGQVGLAMYRVTDDHQLWRETLSQNQSVRQGGLTFTFLRERQFSGLQVVRDHGVTVIFIAVACILTGLALVFYFPSRRLWARVESDAGGAIIHLKGQAPRRADLAREMMRIAEHLKAGGATIHAESPAIIEQRELFAEMGG